MRSSTFRTSIIGGYALVIAILVIGTLYVVRRLDEVATDEVETIRREEREITEVERLRWLGESLVSDGRGFFISGNPELRRSAESAAEHFLGRLSRLTASPSAPQDAELVRAVKETGEAFTERQRELIAARARGESAAELFSSFRASLVPLRQSLETAIAELVRTKESRIDDVYREAEGRRASLVGWMYLLTGMLALSALVVAAFVARRLVRAHEATERAAKAARDAVDRRDELMGILAHDLRNPLGSITLKAALLEQLAESDKIRRHARSISDIGMRMESLIKTMLDVSTLEAGRFAIHVEVVDLDDILRSSFEVFEGLATSKEISLERRVAEAPMFVRADKARILQVLSNLVGNAIKFTPAGGTVRVSAERQGEGIEISVSDTGVGIEPDELPHLFDRFWQRPGYEKKGTGLGLFIAKGIIEAHGGRIWAESEPGRSTTFRFTLAAATSDAAERAAPHPTPVRPAASPGALKPGTVLDAP